MWENYISAYNIKATTIEDYNEVVEKTIEEYMRLKEREMLLLKDADFAVSVGSLDTSATAEKVYFYKDEYSEYSASYYYYYGSMSEETKYHKVYFPPNYIENRFTSSKALLNTLTGFYLESNTASSCVNISYEETDNGVSLLKILENRSNVEPVMNKDLEKTLGKRIKDFLKPKSEINKPSPKS